MIGFVKVSSENFNKALVKFNAKVLSQVKKERKIK